MTAAPAEQVLGGGWHKWEHFFVVVSPRLSGLRSWLTRSFHERVNLLPLAWGMSKEDRIQEAGKAAVDLADARDRLGELQARTDSICRDLEKARKLLCPDGRGKLLADIRELPSTGHLRELLLQIKQERETVEGCTQTLHRMGGPVAKAEQGHLT